MTNEEPNPGLERVSFELRASGIAPEPSNPLRRGTHSRGYLPHVKREGASYFVTFRLADSLPQTVLLEFKRQQAEKLRALGEGAGKLAERAEINREYQRQIERYLDRGAGECHLRRADIARMATEALLHFHNERYLLDEWVIMPNHIHVLLWPMPNHTLSEILRDRKRRIAREANLLLRRTGTRFWQHESSDHWIRDDDQKIRVRRYIRNNPVNSRLCRLPEEWQWGSASVARERGRAK